ncbi:MAG: hypothetical protein V4502_03570 [Pseudomonadota bacterium]
MPLNEAGPRRSNLTAPQRREALAAIYGIPPEPTKAEADELRARIQNDDETPDF